MTHYRSLLRQTSQPISLDWCKNPVLPTNHLAGTSRPYQTATKLQHKNLNSKRLLMY